MKPTYDPYIKRWYVKGLGHYDKKSEAIEAIKQYNLCDTLLIRINPNTKCQLQALAESKNVSASDLIRQLIEREVKDDE